MNSDPTDPNSDDTGLNDSAEIERGSNPLMRENLMVSVKLPNTLEANETGDFDVAERLNDRRLLAFADKYEPSSDHFSNPPAWLSSYNIESDSKHAYNQASTRVQFCFNDMLVRPTGSSTLVRMCFPHQR
ncbi:hypothetical protein HLRTI_000197 [Halorhabdus tiamatea SARL4B]|uniref:Uncharacterized protein n=1 Tax=Halorhabdus tiamatea SARL4B TaxID=1033806 RepID=U2E6I7_9EURY|nr:hypothetical protein HLRTI_000197 [Halorhabdus tiamatea SARL4B]